MHTCSDGFKAKGLVDHSSKRPPAVGYETHACRRGVRNVEVFEEWKGASKREWTNNNNNTQIDNAHTVKH